MAKLGLFPLFPLKNRQVDCMIPNQLFFVHPILCLTEHSNISIQENFDKRDKKKAQITFPLRPFFPLKVVK
jgi:hypothetical protein